MAGIARVSEAIISILWNLLDALHAVQQIDLIDMYSIPDTMRESILKDGIPWQI